MYRGLQSPANYPLISSGSPEQISHMSSRTRPLTEVSRLVAVPILAGPYESYSTVGYCDQGQPQHFCGLSRVMLFPETLPAPAVSLRTHFQSSGSQGHLLVCGRVGESGTLFTGLCSVRGSQNSVITTQ